MRGKFSWVFLCQFLFRHDFNEYAAHIVILPAISEHEAASIVLFAGWQTGEMIGVKPMLRDRCPTTKENPNAAIADTQENAS